MARKRDDAGPVADEPAVAPGEPSEARKAFLAGEITWREYLEAESGP